MPAAHRNCSIAIGESWFHRATLTPVVVEELFAIGDEEPERINFVGPDGMLGGREVEDFVRDYARDEPVTLELLERLGGPEWQVGIVDTLVWTPVAEGPDVPWTSGGMELRTSHQDDGCHSIALRHPDTLRELLVVLRVFGVAESFNNF